MVRMMPRQVVQTKRVERLVLGHIRCDLNVARDKNRAKSVR